MKTLGAVFQCFRMRKATQYALVHYRKFLPDSPLLLISDGGEDFSDLAAAHGCLYEYRPNIYGNADIGYAYDAARTLEWWARQKSAVDKCGTDYILIMEDDVLVIDKVVIETDFHLNGPNCGQPITPEMVVDMVTCSGVPATNYGMCGGSIYNAKTFNAIYDDVIADIKQNHDRLYKTSGYRLLGYPDANMVYHFGKRGFRFEPSPWLAEIQRGERREGKSILHQYKDQYK